MITALIALVVMCATAIQAWSAAIELGRATNNRPAIDTWNTEDALAAEHPRLRRRPVRRELKAMRGPEMHTEIRRIKLTLGSWVALVCASGAAFVQAVWP